MADQQSMSPIKKWRHFGWLEAALVGSVLILSAQFAPDIYRIWKERPGAGQQTPGTFWHRTDNGSSTET